jgi:hypothetical protein
VNGSRLRPPVVHRYLHQNVIDVSLGVFYVAVEVAVFFEKVRIQQLKLRAEPVAPVLVDQIQVRISRLWVLVEVLAVGMRRGRIKVKVYLLDIFAVVAFAVGEAKKSLFQDGVVSVPESRRQAKYLITIAKSPDAFFAPAVGIATGQVVVDVRPGIAIGAIIFPDRTPLPFRKVGAPSFPFFMIGGLRKACVFHAIYYYLRGFNL